jgi:hypothetical protein
VVARTLGYWLLYATVGTLIVLMAIGGGGDLGSEDPKSPTRTRSKVVGACSGIGLAAMALGAYLVSDPEARPGPSRLILIAGIAAATIFSIWSWIWIAADLRAAGRGRRGAPSARR